MPAEGKRIGELAEGLWDVKRRPPGRRDGVDGGLGESEDAFDGRWFDASHDFYPLVRKDIGKLEPYISV